MLFLASKLAVKAFIRTIIPYGKCPEQKKNKEKQVAEIMITLHYKLLKLTINY